VTHSLRIALALDPLFLHSKAGRHAPDLARELLGLGHTVQSFGVPPEALPHSGRDPATEGHPVPGLGLGEGLRAFAPDVIVVYEALSPMAWWGARTARALGVPLILIDAGVPFERRWPGRILMWTGERFFRARVRKNTAAMVVLDPIGREGALRAGFAADRIHMLPGGVDTATFRPGLSSGLMARHRIRGRTLLYVGRIEEGRGLDVLIDAFARTVGQRGDWNLVVAGEGSERGRLRSHADRLGIGSSVYWTGWPRDEELPGLMAQSTFLAVPAESDDVRGVQVARALACGLPVLCSDRPRLRALIEPEVHGLVAPAGDVDAWTAMIRRAAASPVGRRRWGANARLRAETELSWPHIAGRFETLCARLCAKAGSEPVAEHEGEGGTAPDAIRA
jgi:glycosyltransferase involved in cell wall biosynthesis